MFIITNLRISALSIVLYSLFVCIQTVYIIHGFTGIRYVGILLDVHG